MPNLGSQWANVFILPTAGPTPGTAAFAAQFTTPYAPTPTNAPQDFTTSPIVNWNMNHANSWDVVPRAWNGLVGLVEQPTSLNSDYPSFFAAGTMLAARVDDLTLIAAGPDTYTAVNDSMTKSGYVNGATPWYVPCLPHAPFTGSWGHWETKGATSYPNPWNPDTPPSQANPAGTIATVDQLAPWILNAHLGQYSHAFLRFPCPTLGDVSA